MNRAVCLRCGAEKVRPERICPACGHRPEGDGLLVAWLLSDYHLDDKGLDAAASRIARGESLRPSEALLDKARRALGTHADADPGLAPGARVGLLLVSLILTPAVGLTLAAWWWRDRPRAARQALGLALPAGVLFAAGTAWMLARTTGWI